MKNKIKKIFGLIGAFFIFLKQKVLAMPGDFSDLQLAYGPPPLEPKTIRHRLGLFLVAIVGIVLGLIVILSKKTSKKIKVISLIIMITIIVLLILFRMQIIEAIYEVI